MKFPDNFVWGASISAHQSEGDNHNNWSVWEHTHANDYAEEAEEKYSHLASWSQIGRFASESKNYISASAANHYTLYRKDFDLAKQIGIKSLRVSIEWSRIEPLEGEFDEEEMQHYRDYIAYLIELGIEPVVTLWHWTIPVWADEIGGWTNPRMVEYFLRFVEKIATIQEIKKWVVLNEPEVYTREAYLAGRWPPGNKNPFKYLIAIRNLAEAHRKVYDYLKLISPESEVGIAKNNTYFEPVRNRFINKIFAYPLNQWGNHFFLRGIKDSLDFIGLNYYFHQNINVLREQENACIYSDMGWEQCGYGIFFVLKELQKYNLPIYITENGVADMDDNMRAGYIEDTLLYVKEAMTQGVDVRGYYHWSLTDNFEWDKGFWPKFGLVEINYDTDERRIKQSGWRYHEIIRDNGFTSSRDIPAELANL